MATRRIALFLTAALLTLSLAGCGASVGAGSAENTEAERTEISADDAIESVETLGFVDIDGSKISAIAVRYNVDLTGADVSAEDFTITDYGLTLTDNDLNYGENPGAALRAYVNDAPAVSPEGGSGAGQYVIIETDTAFQVSRFARSYEVTMAAGVTQTGTLTTDANIITPSTAEVSNYEEVTYTGYDPNTGEARPPEYYNYAKAGTFAIAGIDGYELHTIESGTAFRATHCFDEANGQYWDFDLPYALYVPDDYDPAQSYALVFHLHDAGSMSSNPMLTLTESQAASNYASDWFQRLAKEQGLGGAIVVCPAIAEFFPMDSEHPNYELRISRDNWTLSCAAPAVWELLDELTQTYSIDPNRIYGSGQSMGGMTIMAMAAHRDNYFAGVLEISCKWGNNYNKDYPFNGVPYYDAPADGNIIWTADSDGNPTDYHNWFYLISDDNILFLNTARENVEYAFLYHDLAGADVEEVGMVLGEDSTTEARNALVNELVSRDSALGIYQVTMTGNVGHMSAWFYGHGTPACYEWLLRQTRESEMKRSKLPLDKAFEFADEQIQTEERLYKEDRENPENNVYYPTGKDGAGTVGYNSTVTALGSGAFLPPGWTPETAES
ncbi:MAG: hypothetical protein IJQ81_16580 [Oscillibacter sp.]|nr:hypothetical protein [Oscillibacter sp.]